MKQNERKRSLSSKPLIVNEVLAYIIHAIDYMDEVSIVQICRSAYKEEEVCSAKLMLFQSLGQLEQMPSRRRDGGDKSLQDIISLLKRTDPDDVPEFVARDLHKLPPVTFDHVDVTRLLKDITCLKASLEDMKSKMEASQATINDLRGEVALLRNATSKDTCDKDGFVKVERRKKKPPCRNQCGTAQTGPNILLRPAVPTTQLYVSRLHHTTTVEQIVEYVRSKTNWTLRVEKLESRHNTNFKSFMVRVPTHHFETFLKEEFWPKGVVFRRFRGRLRDTTQRNTTPTLRVH
ncbi:hypothetical protein SFRURICE_017304 [Spodoptera frugiperda]|nr:hypothetical protein SFRURICE_017304 [Spodoptera frugiperda]